MIAGRTRMLTERGLAAGEAALDLFFETWRLCVHDGDSSRARRLRLGALRLLQRVTAVGLEESRGMARVRLREARVELRRLVNAVGQGGPKGLPFGRGGAEGQTDSVRRWDALATSVGHELSRLNQVLCSPEPWMLPNPQSLRPLTFDPKLTTHDSRLTTH